MRALLPLFFAVTLASPVVFANTDDAKKTAVTVTQKTKPVSADWNKKAVLSTMEAVADWQLKNPSRYRQTNWTQGAGFTGMMALSRISPDSRYEKAMLKMGEDNEWELCYPENVKRWKKREGIYFADDHVVGQTYLDLYAKYKKPEMLEHTQATFDYILANPKTTSLHHPRNHPNKNLRWTWCDALFMAPPVLAKLWQVTGDEKYLQFMDSEWKATSNHLYDKTEHLYFRDDNYLAERESNGAKVFWSRGNGWVMGGLARVLEILPKDSKYRPFYETQFKEMAAKLISIQQPSGFWSTSLLAPERISQNETSGTGFFCFALAWGINNGLLEKEKYLPAVKKSWNALVSCVEENGKLTHVQPVGADPFNFKPDSTATYGTGAFLLAGAEIYKLAE